MLFIGLIFGIIGISTLYWTEDKVTGDYYGLERRGFHNSTAGFEEFYVNAELRQVAEPTFALALTGIIFSSLCWAVAMYRYNGNEEGPEKLFYLLHRYGAVVGGVLQLVAVFNWANANSDSALFAPTARYGYSFALFTTSAVLALVFAMVKHFQFKLYYQHFKYQEPKPLYYFLTTLLGFLLLLIGTFTRGWILWKGHKTYFGLTEVEYGGYIVPLADFSDVPSKTVVGTSTMTLIIALLAMGQCIASLSSSVAVMFGQKDMFEGRIVYFPIGFDLSAAVLSLICVTLYGALFPEMQEYHFSTSFVLVVIASFLLFATATANIVNTVGRENLKIVNWKYFALTCVFALVWIFMLIGIASRHWTEWKDIDGSFGLAKVTIGAGRNPDIFGVSDIPSNFVSGAVLKKLETASACGLAFGCASLMLLIPVIVAALMLSWGKEFRYLPLITSVGSTLSSFMLLLCILMYAALLPRHLQNRVTREWGWSFVITTVTSSVLIVTNGAAVYMVWGTAPLSAFKDAEYPRTAVGMIMSFFGVLFSVIATPSRYWMIARGDLKIHFGLSSGVYHNQEVELENYSALSHDLKTASTSATGFAILGLLFAFVFLISNYHIFSGKLGILKGKLTLIATSTGLTSAILMAFSMLSYHAFLPNPLYMRFDDDDVREYELVYGYSFAFQGLASGFMLLGFCAVLWASRTEAPEKLIAFANVVTLNGKEGNKNNPRPSVTLAGGDIEMGHRAGAFSAAESKTAGGDGFTIADIR
jgi:hypothetical protein